MGGGGSYYDRDVTDVDQRTSAGYSTVAEAAMARRSLNPAVVPRDRRVATTAKGPLVYAFDVTGSMGTLPKIIYDKMPLIAGQIAELGYIKDPQMCLAAVGDAVTDDAPVQVGDFSPLRGLDDWLQRLWLEGGGGGQGKESYELMAYFFATRCEIKEAKTPIFLFTGDEGYRDRVYKNELTKHFGGEHSDAGAQEVFDKLKQKFAGNVFLIHRTYTTSAADDSEITAMWRQALGKERVVQLGTDLAIADVTLGLLALVAGTRNLAEYLDDMKTKRLEAQTDERVAEVRTSLEPLAAFLGRTGPARKGGKQAAPAAPPAPAAKKGGKKPAGKRKKPGGGKSGRI